jgi:hypothetical protein
MNFGYLIVVSTDNTSTIDYPAMAYALAISIKNTQKEGYDKVAIVINDKSKLDRFKSPWVFDQIIEQELPAHWDGRSWMDKLTPFDHTVCLDADMLFTRDYSHWIDYFIENSELYVANRSYTYRAEIVKDEHYRKAFIKNDLPNLYSFWTFFKKDSELVNEFFTLGRAIINNPIEFSNLYLSAYKPKVVGTDEAFALSAKILDIVDEISYDLDFPKVTHLKPLIQNWPWEAEAVSDHVGFYLNKAGKLKIGNYQQHNIVHYVEKDKMTDEFINVLEEVLWKK